MCGNGGKLFLSPSPGKTRTATNVSNVDRVKKTDIDRSLLLLLELASLKSIVSERDFFIIL